MNAESDFQEQLTETSVIAANAIAGLLSLFLVPVGLSGIADIGIPVGATQGVTFGIFASFVLLPVVMFSLAYYGYTGAV